MNREHRSREGSDAQVRRVLSERCAQGASAGTPTREYRPHAQAGEHGAATRNQQAPLGEHPGYDDVLDVAVQYTFPCSDPIAVDADAVAADGHSSFAEDDRPPGAGAEPQTTDTASRPR